MPVWKTLRSVTPATLPLVLAGCMIGGDFGVREQADWTGTYTLAPGGELSMTNTNGVIEVRAWDQPKIEVRAEKIARAGTREKAREALAAIEITERVRPDAVEIETKLPQGGSGGILPMLLGGAGNFRVDYHVRAPADALVRLQTSNGKVSVIGIRGGTKAQATNGGVDGEDLGGHVVARTTNGYVRVGVREIKGDGVELRTTNGVIALKMPATAGADLSARVTNGAISLDDVTLEANGTTSRRRVEGRVNGGGPRVELETTNGSIRISGVR